MEQARARIGQYRHVGGALVLTSAGLGFPPFYVITVVAGIVRLRFPVFFLTGLLGRLVRFAVIAGIPQLIKMGISR